MIPLTNANENPRIPTGKFLGLNRLDKGNDGEFIDMKNMGSSHYPCLAPRGKRRLVYTAAGIDPEAGEKEILGIFPPAGGGGLEEGFCGVTAGGVYNAGARVEIETDKTRGGWFKGNWEPEIYCGPVQANPGVNSTLISFYNPGRGRMELLRVWKTENLDELGYTEEGQTLENLRRGITAKRSGSAPSAVFTDVKARLNYNYYSIDINRKFSIDSQNKIEDGIVRVTGKNGNIIEFPSGTFKYHTFDTGTIEPNYQLVALRKDFIMAILMENTGEAGLLVEILSKNNVGSVTAPSNTQKDQTVEVAFNLKNISSSGVEQYFSIGDELEIEGFTKDAESGVSAFKGWCISARLASTTNITATKGDNETAWSYINSTIYPEYIFRKLPKAAGVCVHQNRLWCASVNGNYIYASALGDWGNFYKLDGVDDNSAYFEINTPGEFIGICSYRDMVLAFKRDSISIVYGNSLGNYGVEQTVDGIGCIDAQSIYTVGGVLYFLGGDGFYAFNGSTPERISNNLNCRYDKAYGFGDGYCYYASARRADNGEYELLVFDSRYGIWTKEDGLQVISAVYYQNHLYAATKDAVYELNAQGGTETVEWEATGVVLYEDTFQEKGVNEIRIRARIPEGAGMEVYTAVNGEEFILQKELLPALTAGGQAAIQTYRVPVRFQNAQYYQIRLAGRGECVVYDIERAVYAGGKEYRRR